MTDINTPLLKEYYGKLSVLGYPCYSGEEPDDIQAPEYIVISDVTNSDQSTKNSTDINSSIQVSIHTWKNKYNSSLDVNSIAGQVFAVINPKPQSILVADNCQIVTTKLITDRTERIGELGGRKYISRILVFSHYIYTT